jgi:hypothetical protein
LPFIFFRRCFSFIIIFHSFLFLLSFFQQLYFPLSLSVKISRLLPYSSCPPFFICSRFLTLSVSFILILKNLFPFLCWQQSFKNLIMVNMDFMGIKRRRILRRFQRYKLTLVTNWT